MSLEFLPEYIHAFENSELIECRWLWNSLIDKKFFIKFFVSRKVAKLFNSMFELEKTYSDVSLNEKFAKKVLGWLDNNQEYLKQAYHQVNMFNRPFSITKIKIFFVC